MAVMTRALILCRPGVPSPSLCGISYKLNGIFYKLNRFKGIRSCSPAAPLSVSHNSQMSPLDADEDEDGDGDGDGDGDEELEASVNRFPFLNLGENEGNRSSLKDYLWHYWQCKSLSPELNRYGCIIGCSHGWVVFFHFFGHLYLCNPFTIEDRSFNVDDPRYDWYVNWCRRYPRFSRFGREARLRNCLWRVDQTYPENINAGNRQYMYNPALGSLSPVANNTPLPSLTERSPWRLEAFSSVDSPWRQNACSSADLGSEWSRTTPDLLHLYINWCYHPSMTGGEMQGFPCLFVPSRYDFVGKDNAKIGYSNNGCGPFDCGYGGFRIQLYDGSTDLEYHHCWEDPGLFSFLNFPHKQKVMLRKNPRTMWRGRYLSPDDSRCVGSSKGWLAFLNKYHASFYLFNPLISMDSFSYPFIPLPPIETLPTILRKLSRKVPPNHNSRLPTIGPENILQFPLVSLEAVGEYRCPVDASFTVSTEISPITCDELSKSFIKKVVLSSPPSPFPSRESSSDSEPESPCTVMIMYGYKEESQLAFCRIGDKAWTSLHGPRNCSYLDIVYSSHFQIWYALCETDHLEVWDLSCLSSPKMTLMKSEAPLSSSIRLPLGNLNKRLQLPKKKYLVDCSGHFWLVVRYFQTFNVDKPHKCENKLTRCFDVFALDREDGWIQMKSLEGRTFFVGINECIAVRAADYPGLKSNCIYYTCIDREMEPNTEGAYELGVYDVEHDVIDNLYMDDFNKINPHPIWIFPQT